MKKISLAAISLGLSLFAGLAFADIPLKSTSEIQGSWVLLYTKKSAAAEETIKREDTWTFKDGIITITHIPRDGTYYDQSPVKYEIEEGKLTIGILGRPGKFDVFSLVERDDKNMTLKGKFGDIYQFSKK